MSRSFQPNRVVLESANYQQLIIKLLKTNNRCHRIGRSERETRAATGSATEGDIVQEAGGQDKAGIRPPGRDIQVPEGNHGPEGPPFATTNMWPVWDAVQDPRPGESFCKGLGEPCRRRNFHRVPIRPGNEDNRCWGICRGGGEFADAGSQCSNHGSEG